MMKYVKTNIKNITGKVEYEDEYISFTLYFTISNLGQTIYIVSIINLK